jgi:subtilisin family serine protease
MRKGLGLAASVVLGMFLGACHQSPPELTPRAKIKLRPPLAEKRVPTQLLVRFKRELSLPARGQLTAKLGGKLHHAYASIPGLHLVKVQPGENPVQVQARYQGDPNVAYAEWDEIIHVNAIPDDPSFDLLWGLSGASDADLNAPAAWDLTTGSNEVIIGVLDSGVDYTHTDLADNIWVNPGEIPDNGQDDDNNGYIDDVHGINAVLGTGDPMDTEDHGTHVAGTIAAVGNNGTGVTGVLWNARIIGCSWIRSDGRGSISDAIKCIDYIHDLKKNRGIDVVATNTSWGGSTYSQATVDAIAAHLQEDILFVAAASNDAWDNDHTPAYPARYELPNIIAVAATTSTNGLASFSNTGLHSVHTGAPGSSIYSTVLAERGPTAKPGDFFRCAPNGTCG